MLALRKFADLLKIAHLSRTDVNSLMCSTSEVHLVEMRSESKASSFGSGEVGRLATGALSSVPTPTFTEGTPSYTDSSSSWDSGNFFAISFKSSLGEISFSPAASSTPQKTVDSAVRKSGPRQTPEPEMVSTR